jgi:hypothetical protein
MSTYSNQPQNNTWILWFLTSITLFLLMLIWGSNVKQLPVIYDGLLLLTFVNLIYCIITGFKLK